MADKDCRLCGKFEESSLDHNNSGLHRFKFMLDDYHRNKKNRVKNRNGIEITNDSVQDAVYSFNEQEGNVNIWITPETFIKKNKRILVKFNIRNSSKEDVHVISIILYPFSAFQWQSDKNVNLLEPGETCQQVVAFDPQVATICNIEIPVCFNIQPTKNPDKYFSIYRQIILCISNSDGLLCENDKGSPYQQKNWGTIEETLHPTGVRQFKAKFPIPTEFEQIFCNGLNNFTYKTSDEYCNSEHIKKILTEELSMSNYVEHSQYLLWLEEAAIQTGIKKYNMTKANIVARRHEYLELTVPGLTEGRPSIVKGDIVKLRVLDDHKVYEGVVEVITPPTIYIHKVNMELIKILETEPETEIEVSFCASRLQLERMHAGVVTCIANDLGTSLFPERKNKSKSNKTEIKKFYNKVVKRNEDQRTAVESIVNRTSGHAPYIIYGPPGTGKSVTVVEAIIQIRKRYPSKKILVCAPANATCDMLTQKLSMYCTTDELLRVHTPSRSWNSVPVNTLQYSNIKDEKCYHVTYKKLSEYSIVVSTLHLIGKYAKREINAENAEDTDDVETVEYSPDVLFIDEAAQATEPECCIPIGLLKPGSQMILAGDPKQLGASIFSVIAKKYRLDESFLERLMRTNELYQPISKNPLQYDSNYCTILTLNYRSHRSIIETSNKLFYNNLLKTQNHNDHLSRKFVSPGVLCAANELVPGSSVEFCSVVSQERRTGGTPSYFNEEEIQMVLRYVETLLNLDNCKVTGSDIGVIAPYIRQVSRIKQRLEQAGHDDVEVGTTEAFQGREKRVIIISTVRAQRSLLKFDEEYKLGFVKEERRFNVAITRAKSKLIVIGNPFCLGTDKKCWGEYIKQCQSLGGFHGIPYEPRDSIEREESSG